MAKGKAKVKKEDNVLLAPVANSSPESRKIATAISILLFALIGAIYLSNQSAKQFAILAYDAAGLVATDAEFYAARTIRLWLTLGSLVLLAVPLFVFVYIKSGYRIWSYAGKLYLVVATLYAFYLLAEAVLMYTPVSDNMGKTLGHQLWLREYWPGYSFPFDKRDRPMLVRDTINFGLFKSAGGPKAIFIGDSYTAGDGVGYSDSYPSLLAAMHPDWQMVNLGERGADIWREAFNLEVFLNALAVKPTIIVWQYFGNDIEPIALDKGLSLPQFPVDGLMAHMVNKSFVLDFLYWGFVYKAPVDDYLEFLGSAYKRQDIVQEHIKPMEDVINYCNARGIKLVVIGFPIAARTQWSEDTYLKELGNFAGQYHIPYINMAPLIEKIAMP
ncbi:MAG TPA: SGNH/GDSL hydrolase family protein, partial [Chitinophagales bacterium]|nr:SGNH/GDSL hydrolase family protein [Chitinophagales bacterium]